MSPPVPVSLAAALFALVLASGASAADETPVITVVPREVSFGGRIEFVLGDGRRPFADEDARRLQLIFAARTTQVVAVLGFEHLALSEVRTDTDEILVVTSSVTGVTTDHAAKTGDTTLFTVSLPLAKRSYHGLARLAGTVEVLLGRGEPATARLTLAALKPNQDQDVPGLTGGKLALTERGGGGSPIVFRVNRPAHLAIADLVFAGADGKAFKVRNRKSEWRDDQGRLSGVVDGLADGATVEVRFYPTVERLTAAFAADRLDLGLTVPGRDVLRGAAPVGANDF
jgi:hypothetical protein